MKNDWEILELQEVSNVIDSLHQTPGFAVSGYPMVRAADVKGGFLDFNHSPLVSEEDYLQFIRNHKPQKGDIVISRVGSFFNFSYVNFNHDFCIGQNTSIIVPTINSRFLYYILLSPFVQAQIEKSLVGTSQKTLSLKHIRELKIPTPQLNQQRAIADVLSAFDDKIELNRKMNHTLDKLGQTIFNHFFVDNPDTNKWITKDLSEICSTQYGFTASTLREKEGPRFLRITDMNKDPWITWSQVPFCKISESEFQKYKLSFGDILVSRMADPGKAAIMESDIDSVFASYLVRLIMNNPHYAYFTFLLFAIIKIFRIFKWCKKWFCSIRNEREGYNSCKTQDTSRRFGY